MASTYFGEVIMMKWIALSMLLTACAQSQTALPKVKPPAAALTRCEALERPESRNTHNYTMYLVEAYYMCALRHDAMVKWAK